MLELLRRDDCRNSLLVSAPLILDMARKINFHTHKERAAAFQKVGGAVAAADAFGYAFAYVATDGFKRELPIELTKKALEMLATPDENDPVTAAGRAALFSNQVRLTARGGIISWYRFARIAFTFGFSYRGLMPATNFIYNPGTNRFINIAGDYNEWSGRLVDEYCQPVLVDAERNFYVNASDWIKEYATVSAFVYDPSLATGLNLGVTAVNGEVREAMGGGAVFNYFVHHHVNEGHYNPDNPELYVQPFMTHCRMMFANEEDVTQFVSWCAHLVQKPGDKVRWAPVIYSHDQGVGKDTLLNFISDLIGLANSATIKAGDLSNSFNEYAQALMIRISELYDNGKRMGKRSFQEEVKALISGDSPYLKINVKYGQKYLAKNVCRVVITTNNAADLLVSEEDRRYDVFECKTKKKMGIENVEKCTAHFNALYSWFYKEGGREDLYSFLKNYPLGNFNPSLPRSTEAKRLFKLNSVDNYSWLLTVFDEIEKYQPAVQQYAFRVDTVIKMAKRLAESPDWDGPPQNSVHRLLRSAFAGLNYEYVRSAAADGRWSLLGKKTQVIKKKNVEVDVIRIALNFASPAALDSPARNVAGFSALSSENLVPQ